MNEIQIFSLFGSIFLEDKDTLKKLSDMDKKASEVGKTFGKLGAEVSGIGKALSLAITAPLLAAAGAGFRYNATMEDFTANFETMLGSADKAKAMLADLTEFAKSTPFEMTGLADAAKVLLNFGVESKDVMNTIKMLGDVSLGNQEKLGRITLAFGQIQSTGRLMGQDLNQLINSGFNPLQVISEKTGRSMASLKKDMEAGAISSDMVTDAFKTATSEGGRFYGAMDRGSKTFNGQMSTLKDTVNITLGETIKPLFEELSKNILPKVIAAVEKIGKAFSSLSEEQKLNILKWAGIAAAAGPLLLVIGKLITTIPALITGVKLLGLAFTFLTANPIILGIAAIATVIGLVVYAAGSASREVNKMTASLIESYEKEAEAQKETIDKNHKARIDSLNNQIDAEKSASGKRLKIIQDEYDEEVKGAAKKEKALKENLQERKSAIETEYKDAIQRIKDEYGVFEGKEKNKTEIVQEETKKRIDALDAELAAAKETYDTNIAKINEEYGIFEEKHKNITQLLQEEYDKKTTTINEISKLSEEAANQEGAIFEKTYAAILEKAREVHDEKILMYEKEYLVSMGLINSDLAAKVKGFQDEIDGINNKTKEEDRIAKVQSDAEKIIALQKKVDDAKTDEDKKTANENLQTEVNRQNREKLLEQRKDDVTSLNTKITDAVAKAKEEKGSLLIELQGKISDEQIEIKKDTDWKITEVQRERIGKEAEETLKLAATNKRIADEKIAINTKATKEIAKIQEERIAKETAETAKYTAAKKSLDDQLKGMDDWLPKYQKKLDAELLAKQQTEKDKLQAAQSTLNAELAIAEKAKTDEKAKVDESTRIKTETAKIKSLEAELKKLNDKPWYLKGAKDILQISNLEKQIEAERQRLRKLKIPGYEISAAEQKAYDDLKLPTKGTYAEGTSYVPQVGSYMVGEKGPEEVILPRGAAVIPNNKLGGITINLNYPKFWNRQDSEKVAGDIINILRGAGVHP